MFIVCFGLFNALKLRLIALKLGLLDLIYCNVFFYPIDLHLITKIKEIISEISQE